MNVQNPSASRGIAIQAVDLVKNYGTGLNAKYGYAGAVSMLIFLIVGSLIAIEFLIERKMSKDA